MKNILSILKDNLVVHLVKVEQTWKLKNSNDSADIDGDCACTIHNSIDDPLKVSTPTIREQEDVTRRD